MEIIVIIVIKYIFDIFIFQDINPNFRTNGQWYFYTLLLLVFILVRVDN